MAQKDLTVMYKRIRDVCASLQKVHECSDPKIATPQHIAKLAAKKEPGRIVDNRLNRPLRRRLLCLAALITRRQHTRMPLLILGVGITEPLPTRRAAYGRRVVAGRIAKGDALAQPLQSALSFSFSSIRTTYPASPFYPPWSAYRRI